jgi:ABC-2 type transport system ATP-binding protein
LPSACWTPQPILLIDEPFEGLDLRQRREVAETLDSALTDGRTLVLSIHQISEAARVCDRFVLLSGGRVAAKARSPSWRRRRLAIRMPARPNLEELFLALT